MSTGTERRYLADRLQPLRTDPCPPKTRADLEWTRLLDALAARCASPLGHKLALSLPFADTRDEARAWLAQSAEAVMLLEGGRSLTLGSLDEVDEAIERARVGGVLAPVELRSLGKMLGAARGLRKLLASRRADVPALFAACSTDPTLDDVADAIAEAFEPDGTLADRASDRLRELRGEYLAARQRMLGRMEDLMSRYEAVLQDRFVTEREGRWVLPVRSDAHERFPGIVHATSSSGATLFVEPRVVVPMGNRLKVLDAEVKREEETIYARLTALVTDALTSVEAAARALALADVRSATATLARDLRLLFPEVVDEPLLDLKRARHPLLALDVAHEIRTRRAAGAAHVGVGEVVGSDLALQAGRAMVISGPNAGGKTVALKTMGLAALMIRSGMPIPCDEGSLVGLFDVVLTDVGDDQSLQKNLSTFSAHVSNVANILSDTTRGALVLLDELAGGTDPREGEALAVGVLDSLCARGGAVAATTHYEGLKALALADARFDNASVGFDLKTLTPTFAVAMGVPGTSSALAVAQRFGMPSTVIDRAGRFLTRAEQSFEAVVKKLHDERAALELARNAAEEREREARQAKSALDAELLAAKNRERRTLTEEAQAIVERLQRARDDLRAAQSRLRAKKVDAEGVREAERLLERVAGDVAIGGLLDPLLARASREEEPPAEPVRSLDLRRGARVWVGRLRSEAEIVDVLNDGTVRVAAGPLKLTVPVSDLRSRLVTEPAATTAHRPDRLAGSRDAHRPAAPAEAPLATRNNTCDLRGLRVDDGLAMATTFLDRALGEGRRVAFLLHGYGTGALRDAIRKDLARSPYVAKFHGAEPDRGGDGVTVVWLA